MVVVDNKKTIVSIISKRDIVRMVAKENTTALTKPINSYISANMIFTQPNETIDALLERMTDHRIHHLPIIQNNHLTRIISINNLIKYKIQTTQAEAEGLKAYIAAN